MMKAFLVTVSTLCVSGILLSFLAYATGRLPGVPVVTSSPQIMISQTAMETDPLCSPCVERIALMLEMVQEWEDDQHRQLETTLVPEARGWVWSSPEQREQAQQLDQYGPEEGLHRLRESDPEAARQFEQEQSPSPAHDEVNDDESSTR